MAKPLDPMIKELLVKYEIDPKAALWDCHGTWVMYHRYIEVIGAKIGAILDKPEIMFMDQSKKELVIYVMGRAGNRVEWSFGEVSPANNKNGYPWAMAEKRAKDRVLLKLAGLAGHIYSEEEADDFKESKPVQAAQQTTQDDDDDESVYVTWAKDVVKKVAATNSDEELTTLWKANIPNFNACKAIDESLANRVKAQFSKRKNELIQQAAE